MESTEMFLGGLFFTFIATFIVALFAMNKNIGFFGTWIIGLGIGTLISFVLGTNVGLGAGIVSSLIAVVTSSTKSEYKDEPQPKKSSSVADELAKLKDLKDKGILTETEFEEQKQKLLKRDL